jgi:hypothetical protein
MPDWVAEPPQFSRADDAMGAGLRRGLIALSLPMPRYEKATRTAALKFQIPDYNDVCLARQLDELSRRCMCRKPTQSACALVFHLTDRAKVYTASEGHDG